MAQLSAILLSRCLAVTLFARCARGANYDLCKGKGFNFNKVEIREIYEPLQISSTQTKECLAKGITCARNGVQNAEILKRYNKDIAQGFETVCATSGACEAWPLALVDAIALSEPNVDEFHLTIDESRGATICLQERENAAETAKSILKKHCLTARNKIEEIVESKTAPLRTAVEKICDVIDKNSEVDGSRIYRETTRTILDSIVGFVRKQAKIDNFSSKLEDCKQEQSFGVGCRRWFPSRMMNKAFSQIQKACLPKESGAVVAAQVILAICLVLLVVAVVVLSILFKKVTEKYVSIDKKLGSFQASYPTTSAAGLVENQGHVTPPATGLHLNVTSIHAEAPPTQPTLPTELPKADFVANMTGGSLGKGTGTTGEAPMDHTIGTGETG